VFVQQQVNKRILFCVPKSVIKTTLVCILRNGSGLESIVETEAIQTLNQTSSI